MTVCSDNDLGLDNSLAKGEHFTPLGEQQTLCSNTGIASGEGLALQVQPEDCSHQLDKYDLDTEPPEPVSSLPTATTTSGAAKLRHFLRFVGPTWLIAVAFTDPGGITASLQQGSETRFALLWITWWSTVFGYVFQVLAARIGMVSGKSLGKLCVERYGTGLVKYIIWFFMEAATFGDDIQACVGAAVALQIMTSLPWWSVILLTLVVSVLFTLAYYWARTKIEKTIGFLLLSMLVLVCINAGESQSNVGDVLYGWVVPRVPAGQVLTVVGSIGGVLTPEALFLGSAMVLTRPVDRSDRKDIRRSILYSTIELMFGMVVAFLILLCVTVTFAHGFYRSDCAAQGLAWVPSEGQCDEISLNDGPEALRSLYGTGAKWIFAIVLLLSGLNSMISTTIAGQVVWEGFSGRKVPFWKLVLVTRCIVLVPTLVLALTEGNNDVNYTIINDWVNVFMSLAMPFAVIPVIDIAASKLFMKDMAIGYLRLAISVLLALALIGINFYLLAEFLFDPINFGSTGDFPTSSAFYAGMGAVWAAYAWLLWQVAHPSSVTILEWLLPKVGLSRLGDKFAALSEP